MLTLACSRCSPAASWAICSCSKPRALPIYGDCRHPMHRDVPCMWCLIQSTVFRQGHGRVPGTAVALLRPAPAQALLAGLSGLVSATVLMSRSESVLPRLHRGYNPESGASQSSGWSGEGWTATWAKCSARSHARRRQAEHPPDFLLQCWLPLYIAAQCPRVGPALRNRETAGIDEID